jgi:hypothetical protein
MRPRTYRVRYKVEFGEWTREQLGPDGGADAVMIASVMREKPNSRGGDGGSVNTAFLSRDGFTGEELSAGELFKIWGVLASHLTEELPAGSWQREVVAEAFTCIRAGIMRARGMPEPER